MVWADDQTCGDANPIDWWHYPLRFRNNPIPFCDPTQAINDSNAATQ